MWYKINFRTLSIELLPTFLRKSVTASFVQALLSPLITAYDKWLLIREEHLYKLEHNGQVCYLRKSLNDKFDNELRRIYIGDGITVNSQYIFTSPENQPKYLGTLFIHNSFETTDNGYDFIVYVPTAIATALPYELKAHIDFYREGVKRYRIEHI